MQNVTKIYVGVDVAKNWLDIHIHPLGESMRVDNSVDGLDRICKQLADKSVEQIVCESSGGYENLMVNTLRAKKYVVWRVDPKRVKAFIASEGVKAKTDAIDARMIALFASQKQCKYLTKGKSDSALQLTALVKRRNDLSEIAALEKRRMKAPDSHYCRASIENIIKIAETEVADLDRKINELIKNDSDFNNRKKIIESIPGLGPVTAAALLANMSELGTLENKEAAALLGVAPYSKQSGTYRGFEFISGGRFLPRKALYMAALTAARCNPMMKIFYTRLRKAGKKAKVALVAVMNKLIGVINAMLKKNTPWSYQEIYKV